MQRNGYVGSRIGLFIFIIALCLISAILYKNNTSEYQNNISNNDYDNGNSSTTNDGQFKWCMEDSCISFASSNYACAVGNKLNIELVVNNKNELTKLEINNDYVKNDIKYVIQGGDKTIYKYELSCNKVGTTELTAIGKDGKNSQATIQILDTVTPIQNINIGKTKDKMYVGDKNVISVEFNPLDASNQNLRWYTSDKRIIEVEDGYITALSPGTARITAIAWNDDDIYYESHIDITVFSNPTSPYVGFNSSDYVCQRGNSIKITSKVCNDSIKNIATSNLDIANVSGMIHYWENKDDNCTEYTYVVDCKSTGETNIIVDSSSNTIEVPIKVVDEYIPVTSISIGEYGFRNIRVGESLTLVADVLPIDATNKKVYWTSSNPQTFIVDQDGVLTAVGSGKSQITATVYDDDTVFYSDTIEFNAYLSEEELSSSNMIYFDRLSGECKVGKTTNVTIHLTYNNNGRIGLVGQLDKVKSLDESIVTISKADEQTSMCLGCTDYEIKCKKAGTTKIEATTTKGGKAIYTVTVK